MHGLPGSGAGSSPHLQGPWVILSAVLAAVAPLRGEDPEPEAAFISAGRSALERGLPGEALARFLRGLEAHPSSPALHREASKALLELGQRESAARHLEAALESHPAHVTSLIALALIRSDEGRLDEAARLLLKAVELDPRNAAASHDRAVVEARRGNMDAAVAEFRRAAGLAPREARVRYGLGSALEKLGKLEEARAELEAACALDSSFPPPRYRLSTVLFRLGRKEDGERELRRFRELKAAVHAHRGEALAGKKDLHGAVKEYQRAVDALPDHAASHGRLGSLYLELRDPAKAFLHARQAAELDPSALRFANLSWAAKESGDTAASLRWIQKALELEPERKEFLEQRAAILEALRR